MIKRENDIVWTKWIKEILWENLNIFSEKDYSNEAHHINGLGCINEDTPINMVVIPCELHKIYTQKDYYKCSNYINNKFKQKGVQRILGSTKDEIDRFFYDESKLVINCFQNKYNQLPINLKYEAVIDAVHEYDKEKYVAIGRITDKKYDCAKITCVISKNNINYDKLTEWKIGVNSIIGKKFIVQIIENKDKNNNLNTFANLIELKEN